MSLGLERGRQRLILTKGDPSMTKILLAATALTAIVATSAFAQTTQRQVRDPFAYSNAHVYPNGFGTTVQRRFHNGDDVYDTRGVYVGADPDPSVRDQLSRDPTQGD